MTTPNFSSMAASSPDLATTYLEVTWDRTVFHFLDSRITVTNTTTGVSLTPAYLSGDHSATIRYTLTPGGAVRQGDVLSVRLDFGTVEADAGSDPNLDTGTLTATNNCSVMKLPTAPRSVRLAPIAHRIYKQPCRAWVGLDSKNTDLAAGTARMPWGCYQKYRPNWWSGWAYSGDDDGTGVAGGIFTFGKVQGGHKGFGAGIGAEGGAPSGGAGDAAIWPGYFGDTGNYAADQGAGNQLYFSDSVLANQALFSGIDWGQAAHTCRLVMFRSSSNGFATIGLRFSRQPSDTGNTTASAALTSGAYTDVDVAVGASTTEKCSASIRAANPNIDETGKATYLCAIRRYRDEYGLQLYFGGIGGSGVAQHVDTARVADSAIAAAVTHLGINTLIVDVGENDTIDDTWNMKLVQLIQRWRAAVGSSFLCLLKAPWQSTGGITATAQKNAAQYMAAIAFQSPDVGFYNAGGEDNAYAKNNSLLADGVHTNAAGALYFAGLDDANFTKALQQAAGRAAA